MDPCSRIALFKRSAWNKAKVTATRTLVLELIAQRRASSWYRVAPNRTQGGWTPELGDTVSCIAEV